MTCNQCAHQNICYKMHLLIDSKKEKFYADLTNIEEVCGQFAHNLSIKTFPCYVGQKLWMIKEIIQNNIKTPIVTEVYVISIRYRNALASDIIDCQNTEERVQIFVGPNDSYELTELSDTDFGKKLFYNEAEIKKYLENTYGKEN